MIRDADGELAAVTLDVPPHAGSAPPQTGFFGHPKGLQTLFFTEMWERFSYYGMRALLILFMTASIAQGGLGWDAKRAATVYGLYTAGVYFTAIPGGWIADRLLGQRRAVLWGGVLIALGHYSLALNILPFFFAGLVLIVFGTGLLKPNISSMVGQLYAPSDQRRDAGFSIFYMGINTGALIAPIICSYLGEKVAWHWGFGAAAIGMTCGLVQYVLGGKRLGQAGLLQTPPVDAGATWARVIGVIVAGGALLWALWDFKDFVILGGTAVFFAWLVRQGHTPTERKRIGAVIVLFVFATLFWGAFEQAGSSLNLFAQRFTRRIVFGWEFPAGWFQSMNSLFLVLLAPVFAWAWIRLGKREPSSPTKFVIALVCVGLGFLVVARRALLLPHARRAQPQPRGDERGHEAGAGAAGGIDDGGLVPVHLPRQLHRRARGRSLRDVPASPALRRRLPDHHRGRRRPRPPRASDPRAHERGSLTGWR
jgi:POT family proton-dependent oligopeptide transporter